LNSFQIACKFVPKAYPEEKVGIHVLKNARPNVIEYSEMTQEMIHRKDNEGNLFFDISHIVNAMYSVEFLEVAATSSAKQYHLAKKKIKFFDEAKGESVTPSQINGYKFELFYFDVLPMSDPEKFGLIEVKREEEFAPVKNAPGTSQDSPDTARSLISNLHQSWLEAKGVKFDKKAGSEKDLLFELDIRSIYDARDPSLEKYLDKMKSQEIKLPAYITLSDK
jgi:UDP-N-acetylglucosamine/UDP-N-acetylgalactosamine diphosphorylase